MIIPRVIAVLFITLVASVSVFADEAFDFFVEACRHSGYNPAEIATFQADLKIVTKTAWHDSHVESVINRARNKEENMNLPPEKRQEYEKFLESFRQELSDGTRTSTNKVFIRNSALLVGLTDARTHILIENQTNKQSTFFAQSTEGQITATRFGEDAVMINEQASEPAVMYHLLGRIETPRVRRMMKFLLSDKGEGDFDITDAGIAAFKKDCEANQRTFILSNEKVKYEGNHYASILEVYEKGKLKERFWIDSDRGYICPKVQEFLFHDSNDTVTLYFEIISENFALDNQSQKWFPTKIVRVSGKDQETKTGKPEQRTEISVVPETLILNQPIPDSVFAIAVQQGRRVDDFRRDDNVKITFLADEPGKLDLSTVAEKSLDDLPWLTPREVHQPEPPYELPPAKWSWMRILCLLAGIILIIWGLIRYFFFKI